MRVAVWQTDHEISQTVSKSLAKGFNADLLRVSELPRERSEAQRRIGSYDAHIAYGILRGTAKVFKLCDQLGKPWLNVDKGYFWPNHYDGYYRLSYHGTQLKWHDGIPAERVDSLNKVLMHTGQHYLIAPPTDHVAQFFGINQAEWMQYALSLCVDNNYEIMVRKKGCLKPIWWTGVHKVITFNSSLGWEALHRLIPVISDTTYSAIGSYYATKCIDNWLTDMADIPYCPLIGAMKAHQFTLAEIEDGKANALLGYYLNEHASNDRLGFKGSNHR